MRRKLLLACAATLLLSCGAAAQKKDVGRIPLKTVTLVTQAKRTYDGKALFNFEHALRGDARRKQPHVRSGPVVRDPPVTRHYGDVVNPVHDPLFPNVGSGQLTMPVTQTASTAPQRGRRDEFDIVYGALKLNGNDRWLGVVTNRNLGTRSVLKDLGPLGWADVTSVPVVRAGAAPHSGGVSVGPRGRMVGPEGVIAAAVPGHMYVLHVKDAQADYYVMFRVDEITPEGECKLSWKRVPSPEKD